VAVVTIKKGDLLITQSFESDAEEAEIRAAFEPEPGEPPDWDRINAWKMNLARQHAVELGLAEDFEIDDLVGISVGYQG